MLNHPYHKSHRILDVSAHSDRNHLICTLCYKSDDQLHTKCEKHKCEFCEYWGEDTTCLWEPAELPFWAKGIDREKVRSVTFANEGETCKTFKLARNTSTVAV